MSSTTKNVLTKLGVSTTSCFHGVRGNGEEYPNNATATFILEQVVSNCQKPEPDPRGLMKLINKLVANPQSRPHLDANLLKSLVMIGTDLMQFCTGIDDKKLFMAMELAVALSAVEEYLDHHQGELFVISECPKLQKAGRKLDCPRGIVLFYDMRNPCSCLDQAKELHKERMGRCNYRACATYCSDAKLLTCKRCMMQKYCSKACQKKDWSDHKRLCKIVEKHNKQSLNKK